MRVIVDATPDEIAALLRCLDGHGLAEVLARLLDGPPSSPAASPEALPAVTPDPASTPRPHIDAVPITDPEPSPVIDLAACPAFAHLLALDAGTTPPPAAADEPVAFGTPGDGQTVAPGAVAELELPPGVRWASDAAAPPAGGYEAAQARHAAVLGEAAYAALVAAMVVRPGAHTLAELDAAQARCLEAFARLSADAATRKAVERLLYELTGVHQPARLLPHQHVVLAPVLEACAARAAAPADEPAVQFLAMA